MIETIGLTFRGSRGMVFLNRQPGPQRLATILWCYSEISGELTEHAILSIADQRRPAVRLWRIGDRDPFTAVKDFAWELVQLIDPNTHDLPASCWHVAQQLLPVIVRTRHEDFEAPTARNGAPDPGAVQPGGA